MLNTYEAILRGNVIEWRKDAPRHLARGKAVNVHITVLDEPAEVENNKGRAMAAALQQIAQSQTFSGVDAMQWEREVREERPLPGRDE